MLRVVLQTLDEDKWLRPAFIL